MTNKERKLRAEILENLRTVAGKTNKISRSKYRVSNKRKFASSTVESHFGSFTRARQLANLQTV